MFFFFSIKGLAGWVRTLNGKFHYFFFFFETTPNADPESDIAGPRGKNAGPQGDNAGPQGENE